jgi:Cu-Zn family superoxide dismutase
MTEQISRLRQLFVTAAFALVSGCASTPSTRPAPVPAALPSTSTEHLAIAHVTAASGSLVSGTLRLVPSRNDIRISGVIGGLAPLSRHGLLVHVNGNCSAADASAAGDVFMPAPAPTAHGRHVRVSAGNNIVADADGVAHVDLTLAHRALGGGTNDIAGRALVVHALPDEGSATQQNDLRIGCGVIVVVPSP